MISREGYTQFLRAKGLRTLAFGDGLWVEKRPFFWENFPPHSPVSLNNTEVRRLFLKPAVAVRFTCSETEGEPSFEYVCSKKELSLESLAPDARRRVRRGMEQCEVRRIEFDLLAKQGCAINKSTLARQGRTGVSWFTDEKKWKEYMLRCACILSVEAYGAFVDGRLIGYSMIVTVDDYAYLHHTQAFTEDLKYSPINVLTYTVTKTMLERPEISHVSQGLESFVPLNEVERFKLSMAFRKNSLHRQVVVNPLAKPFFSESSIRIARQTLGRIKPGLVEEMTKFGSSLRTRQAVVTIS